MQRFFLILLFIPFPLFSQTSVTLEGIIIDDKGNPLPDAHVFIQDPSQGALTKDDGSFRLTIPRKEKYTITASYLGFQKKEKTLEAGGDKIGLTIQLQPETVVMEDVSVISDRKKQKIKNTSMNMEILDRENLEKINSGSLMENLSSLPGVNSMNIGAGFSKPMIRGLAFNRVAVSENGMKYQGQQWGIDHGLVIDKHNVDDAEVIKGPASLLYGSDALGGVINIKSDRIPAPGTFQSELFTTAKSNNQLLGSSARMAYRQKKFFMHGRGSFQRYGDYHVPAENAIYNSYNLELNGKLINTPGREQAVSIATGVTDNWVLEIPEGQTEYKIDTVLTLPQKNDSGFYQGGDYHLMLYLTNEEGYQSWIGRDLKII